MNRLITKKVLLLPIIRHALTAFGGWLAGSGIATAQEASAIAGGIIAAASVIWGMIEKRQDSIEIERNGH